MNLFQPLKPWAFKTLAPRFYNLVVADCPWRYSTWSSKGGKKGTDPHYKTYTPEEVRDMFPLNELAAPDCLLLCWATAPLLDRQIKVVKDWGFTYASMMIWHKVHPSGKNAIGTGYRVRSMAEPVIVATRGEPKHRAFPGLFQGIRREHSRKPDEFYEIVNQCCPLLTRRADVFVRTQRKGWEAFGDQVDMFAEHL